MVTMQKAPVNSLSLEMIGSLTESLAQLEADKCRGFILTSVTTFLFSLRLSDLIAFAVFLGSAENIQCWARYQRNVPARGGALAGVLDVPSGIVAETVRIKDGQHRSNQCK